MAEVGRYGGPCCATCGGRGIRTDQEGRPTRCVPCSSERKAAALEVIGYYLECWGCTAVLTVADHGGRARRPDTWRLFGALCGYCLAETPPVGSERESA